MREAIASNLCALKAMLRSMVSGEQLRKVLFLHIQKTGGSSIIEAARPVYGHTLISHGDYVSMSAEEVKKKRFISGHFGYDFAEQFMHNRYSFTFLREPKARILSFYYYNMGRDPDEFPIVQLVHDHTLEQFLELGLTDPLVKSRIYNNQAWMLAYGFGTPQALKETGWSDQQVLEHALRNINDFSFVGLTENYDRDSVQILDALGLKPVEDAVNESDKSTMREDLTPRAKSLLDDLTGYDSLLYEAVVKMRGV